MRPSVRKSDERAAPPRQPEPPAAPAPAGSAPSRPSRSSLVVNQPEHLSFLLARISGGRKRKPR
jgi:hypothetical protein